MVSLGVCSMVLGDFGECCVIPRDIFEDSMTAIAIVHTAHGFVIAADGRLRFDDESRLQILGGHRKTGHTWSLQNRP
jgi:hypothetical protein